jgi:putative MATE family efflux protein
VHPTASDQRTTQRTPRTDYTRIFTLLVKLSWPIIIAFSLQTSYNVIDLFWVARLGSSELAAVSLAGTLFYVILALGQVLGSGTVALVSQSYGAGQSDRANMVVQQAIGLTLVIAVLVSVSGFLFARDIIHMLGGTGEVLTHGHAYLRIVFIGFAFQLLSFSINYAFRGTGDMKTPMQIMIIATATNIILDPLLILGIGFFPRLGVTGAALATVIAKGISFLYGIVVLIKGKSGLQLHPTRPWRFDWTIVKTILSVGIPAGISYALMFLSVIAVFRTAASYGKYVLSALGIGQRVLQFAGLPVVGIGVATTTLVGQRLGARDVTDAKRISRVSLICSSAIMIVCSLLFFTQAGVIVNIFRPEQPVVYYGIQFLHIVSLYLVFVGLTTTVTGVFRGAGDMLPPMGAGVIKLAVLVLIAPALARIWGAGGIWWTMLIAYGIEAVIMMRWYASGRWHKKGLELLDRIRVPAARTRTR